MRIKKNILLFACSLQLSACSVSKQIAKEARYTVLSDSLLATAHIGICVYDATENKYLYNYQGDKYFIPASNTKIATCYAAMKYLGDSLVGLRYKIDRDSGMQIWPTGDPTFLHPDFRNQPVYDFLKKFQHGIEIHSHFEDEYEGKGWSWDDYQDDYMVQRSDFPIYGNLIRISKDGDSVKIIPPMLHNDIKNIDLKEGFSVTKEWDNNVLDIERGSTKYREVPFIPNPSEIWQMLHDTLHEKVMPDYFDDQATSDPIHTLKSQPTDSLLKIMMHRSDNFFAEQSLLMVGNARIGVMNDKKIIDTLLATDYAAMPQHPQWVDGSGLSRFDLFTPQDFVFILNKLRNDFSWQRITTIFSTGGDGTLGSYYKTLHGKIFAKTGSLTNDIALSGYLITQKNKTLIFSVLVNNHTASATGVRRAVERFLMAVQKDN